MKKERVRFEPSLFSYVVYSQRCGWEVIFLLESWMCFAGHLNIAASCLSIHSAYWDQYTKPV